MASKTIKVTLGNVLGQNLTYNPLAQPGQDATALMATVTAALAVLVADGASPTQAHVTTLNTAYTALAVEFGSDVTIIVNTAVVVNSNGLKHCLRHVLNVVMGFGIFTI